MPRTSQRSRFAQDEVTQLLRSSLGASVLGIDVLADVYARNTYGLLGVSASVSENELDAAIVRFRNRFRLDPELAFEQSVSVDYGNGQMRKEPLERLGRLRNRRERFIWELFWPHVSDDVFASLKQAGSLTNGATIRLLKKTRRKSKGDGRVVSDHAVAVVQHNLALENEIDYVRCGARRNDKLWIRALSSWSCLLENEEFWEFLSSRITRFDDQHLTAEDLIEVRSQLPVLLLGFHRLFCEVYMARGDQEACRHHLQLLREASLPDTAKESVIGSIRMALLSAELRPLVERACEKLTDGINQLTRAEIERRCRPLLESVFRICRRETARSNPTTADAGVPECDRFCETVIEVLNDRLDFQHEERERNILYWMLMAKRLLRLPVSLAQRHRLQLIGADARRHLYGDWANDESTVDPTQCFFLEGQEADADASFLIHTYKITRRDIRTNANLGTAGAHVQYNRRRILVPRSALAKKLQAELPAGCLYCLLAIVLGIGGVVFFQSGGWDQAMVWYREGVHQLQQLYPPVHEAISQISRFFGSTRETLEYQLRQFDIPHPRLHPAVLPLVSGYFTLWLLLATVRRIGRTRRLRKLRRKIKRYTQGLDSLKDHPSESDRQRLRRESRRTRLQAAKLRCETQLQRIELHAQRRRLKRRLKPESVKTEFPMFERARSQGYKEGTEPSEAEMEMTYAEKQEAAALLRQNQPYWY